MAIRRFILIAFLVSLLSASAGGGGDNAKAQYIPWDCRNWQAASHEDRAIAILESLAANRGQALYCGVAQSAAFSKAEVWQEGRARNERDGTVYISKITGVFRGFTAMQEGWLTAGESGITGYPPARIFEFPEESRKERRRTVRIYQRLNIQSAPTTARGPLAGPTGDLIAVSRQHYTASDRHPTFESFARAAARAAAPAVNWGELARSTARAYCADRGYDRAARVVADPATERWHYTADQNAAPDEIAWSAFQTREWRGACESRAGRNIERLLIPNDPVSGFGLRIRGPLGDLIAVRPTTGDPEATARAQAEAAYNQPASVWPPLAAAAAAEHCRSLGYHQAIAVATDVNSIQWGYTPNSDTPPWYVLAAFQTREWSATCETMGDFGRAALPPGPPVARVRSTFVYSPLLGCNNFDHCLQLDAQDSWNSATGYGASVDWSADTAPAIREHCRALGYRRVLNVVTDSGNEEWGYTPDRNPDPDEDTIAAFKTRHWTATCEKPLPAGSKGMAGRAFGGLFRAPGGCCRLGSRWVEWLSRPG